MRISTGEADEFTGLFAKNRPIEENCEQRHQSNLQLALLIAFAPKM
jgi:hypothetical protein